MSLAAVLAQLDAVEMKAISACNSQRVGPIFSRNFGVAVGYTPRRTRSIQIKKLAALTMNLHSPPTSHKIYDCHNQGDHQQ